MRCPFEFDNETGRSVSVGFGNRFSALVDCLLPPPACATRPPPGRGMLRDMSAENPVAGQASFGRRSQIQPLTAIGQPGIAPKPPLALPCRASGPRLDSCPPATIWSKRSASSAGCAATASSSRTSNFKPPMTRHGWQRWGFLCNPRPSGIHQSRPARKVQPGGRCGFHNPVPPCVRIIVAEFTRTGRHAVAISSVHS